MTCEKCNTEFSGKYCPKCGTPRKDKKYESLKRILYDNSETIIAVLGNNLAQTFVSTGRIGKGFAILSNKRVYFKGKCLIRKGKGYYSKIEEKSVDVSDITGTGFVHNKATWLLVLFIVSLGIATFFDVLLIFNVMITGFISLIHFLSCLLFTSLCIVFIFLYKSLNYSAFEISYAGGGIAFDMHWITAEESKEFQRSINLLKDRIKTNNVGEKTEAPSKTSADIPEQLLKYKALLDQNVITEEEYNSMKKQLLDL